MAILQIGRLPARFTALVAGISVAEPDDDNHHARTARAVVCHGAPFFSALMLSSSIARLQCSPLAETSA